MKESQALKLLQTWTQVHKPLTLHPLASIFDQKNSFFMLIYEVKFRLSFSNRQSPLRPLPKSLSPSSVIISNLQINHTSLFLLYAEKSIFKLLRSFNSFNPFIKEPIPSSSIPTTLTKDMNFPLFFPFNFTTWVQVLSFAKKQAFQAFYSLIQPLLYLSAHIYRLLNYSDPLLPYDARSKSRCLNDSNVSKSSKTLFVIPKFLEQF